MWATCKGMRNSLETRRVLGKPMMKGESADWWPGIVINPNHPENVSLHIKFPLTAHVWWVSINLLLDQ